MPNISSLMYIFSFLWYYGSYMCFFWFIWHFPSSMWQAIIGSSLTQRLRGCDSLWGYQMNLAKVVFLCVLWVSAVLAILCFFCFFESSQSNLCSDPRDRSTGMAVYDAGITSEDYGGCSSDEATRYRCAIIQSGCSLQWGKRERVAVSRCRICKRESAHESHGLDVSYES